MKISINYFRKIKVWMTICKHWRLFESWVGAPSSRQYLKDNSLHQRDKRSIYGRVICDCKIVITKISTEFYESSAPKQNVECLATGEKRKENNFNQCVLTCWWTDRTVVDSPLLTFLEVSFSGNDVAHWMSWIDWRNFVRIGHESGLKWKI